MEAIQTVRYTNIVLTVIAVCLIFLCASPFVMPKTAAQKGAMPVRVVNTSQDSLPQSKRDVLPVRIVGSVDVSGSTVEATIPEGVDVNVTNPELEVRSNGY